MSFSGSNLVNLIFLFVNFRDLFAPIGIFLEFAFSKLYHRDV